MTAITSLYSTVPRPLEPVCRAGFSVNARSQACNRALTNTVVHAHSACERALSDTDNARWTDLRQHVL